MRRMMLGLSIQDVTDAPVKESALFDLTPEACYEKILKVLGKLGASNFREEKEKGFITANRFNNAYEFCIDTTSVGILITPAEGGKTEVVVASENYDLGKFVAKEIFESLAPSVPVEP